jgi:hypothetical protein
MQSWAARELQSVNLGHQARHKRLVTLVEDFAAAPTAPIPAACGTPAKTKAAYRFLSCEQVAAAAIRQGHIAATVQRACQAGRILVLQDTTSLDFTAHPATQDLGPLDHPGHSGLKVHSGLATTLLGVPLGLLYQETWARDGATVGQLPPRRQRATADKESQRWLNTVAACEQVLPAAVEAIVVGDREADIYDLLAQERRPGLELLVRAAHNRRVTLSGAGNAQAKYLWQAVQATPARGQLVVEVQRANQRQARQATLQVRYAALSLEPPRHAKGRSALQPVPVSAVLVQERQPPAGQAPLCWLLLTTLDVTCWAEAVECVQWYTQRWKIERYHFVLKSGCAVEALQLETAARIKRAVAVYCSVAWRLLWLTYQAREAPQAPCTVALDEMEWRALWVTVQGRQALPEAPPSLRQAVRWIAQLGGFQGRKGDGEPGVKVLWRGLRRLHDITSTYVLLTQVLGNG